MKSFRPHRFPPLSQVVEVGPRQAGDAGQWQASLDEGFRQGMDDGYRQGHQSGLTAGHAEGYAEGHKQGLRQGHEQARQDTLAAFDAVARPVETLLEKLEQLHADYQSAKRKEVVDLVARVARQVIRCELTLQPVQLLALVDETLAAMPPVAEGGVEVYLNAEDLPRARSQALPPLDAARRPAARVGRVSGAGRRPRGRCRLQPAPGRMHGEGQHASDGGHAQRNAQRAAQ
jgi:flagellar assembly protein FliH